MNAFENLRTSFMIILKEEIEKKKLPGNYFAFIELTFSYGK